MARTNSGTIAQIIGAVVDVRFEGELPPILTALQVDHAGRTLVVELAQHLGETTVGLGGSAGAGRRPGRGSAVFQGGRERGLRAADGPGSKAALVYGQMNEPPGARARVGLSGLTLAEYFRDEEGQDVLFFVDNIFRFTQAGSEVSALSPPIPSPLCYHPTLTTEFGTLPDRITSTKKRSLTSVRAIYVPAD